MLVQKAKVSKRILAGFIDWTICLLAVLGLFFYPANAIFSKVFHVDEMKQDNYDLMVQYGILYIDADGNYQYTDAGKDEDNQVYIDYKADETYQNLKNAETLVTFTEMSTSVFVTETILFLIIPLAFGNGQTIGKKLTRLILVDDSYIKVRFLNVFLRYLTILFLGSIISLFTYGIPLLAAFIMMLATKDKRTFHDYLSDTRVIEKDQVWFKNTDERIEFDKANTYDYSKKPETQAKPEISPARKESEEK